MLEKVNNQKFQEYEQDTIKEHLQVFSKEAYNVIVELKHGGYRKSSAKINV